MSREARVLAVGAGALGLIAAIAGSGVAALGAVALALTAIAVARGRSRRAAPSPRPSLTEEGITLLRPGEPAMHLSWNQLVEVSVLTTSDGPLGEDVFFVLRGADGSSCCVPQSIASELVARLLGLPGFDHQTFITAMGSTSAAVFVCWRGRAGDALLVARPPAGSLSPEG